MLIVGQDAILIRKLKDELSKFFNMKDLGPTNKFWVWILPGIEKQTMAITRKKYVERVLKKFNMKNIKPASTPLAAHFKLSKKDCPLSKVEKLEMSKIPYASAVGSLMYAMVYTQLDIAHVVGIMSRFLFNPGRAHWEAVKWILRYLWGTTKFCLQFGGYDSVLEGYTDSNMVGCPDGRKSTSGYVFTFAGGVVSW